MSRSRDVSAVQNNLGVAIPPAAAGKNVLINGGMDIWQRGTSSSSSNGYYTADRWYTVASGTTTVSQDTDVPTGVITQYSIKWVTGASSSFGQWYQAIEQAAVKPLRSKIVTASAWVKTSSYGVGNLILRAEYSNTTDALTSVATFVSDGYATGSSLTSWTKITNTFTVPADAVGLRISLIPDTVQGSGVTVKMTGVQLELGSSATPFSRAGGTIQGELAACQRYYVRFANTSNANATVVPSGIAYSATTFPGVAVVPTTLRTNPTSIEYANLQIVDSAFSQYTVTNVAISQNGNPFIICDFTASGMTAARSGWVRQSSTAGYLAFNAEL